MIVGYDGSEDTLPALRWAAQEAMGSQRPLRVVLAWGLPTMGFSAVSASADLDRSKAEAAARERRVPAEGARCAGLTVDGELVQDKPAQALVDRSADAALVVVGHRGKGRVGRLVLGSVASGVVSHSGCTGRRRARLMRPVRCGAWGRSWWVWTAPQVPRTP